MFRLSCLPSEGRGTRLMRRTDLTTRATNSISPGRPSVVSHWIQPVAVNDTDIQRAAKHLVERHGRNAVAAAQERVDELSKTQEHSSLDVALRVLSVCERLVQARFDPGPRAAR